MIDYEKPMLVFQTDFTYKEGAVCAMYGVVKSVDRTLEIIDGSHELPQFDIWSASYRLYQSMRFWPVGTVFVSVVDPGVGTSRRACVAKTNDGYYIVTPDNGSLTHVAEYHGIAEIREIDETVNRLHGKGTDEVANFHGRDLFGYCAAKFASGIITFEEVGPAYDPADIVRFPLPEAEIRDGGIEGYAEIDDPNFGNLWTNIPTKMLKDAGIEYGSSVHTIIRHDGETVFDREIVFGKTFGEVGKGETVLYNNELNRLSFAVTQGSFIRKYNMDFGPEWTVRLEKR